jgi:hypothetical protein
MARAFIPPENCPVCGEPVPRGAKACPGCGADERSGWDEDATRYDDLDLPDSAFADDDASAPRRARGDRRLWIVVVAVMLAILACTLIFR